MKSRNLLLRKYKFLLLTGMSIFIWTMLFSVVQAESIESFAVDIAVAADGVLQVEERITYNFGDLERHGIFRLIETRHAQPASAWYKKRLISLQPVSVTRDGKSESYQNEAYQGLNLRIGDADQTISGIHEYVISYEVTGALSEVGDMTELYWNVTGNQWDIPIKRTEVTVRTKDSGELGAMAACYVGLSSTNNTCQEVVHNGVGANKTVTFVHDKILPPGEELTIAQELNLAVPVTVIEENNLIYFMLGISFVWFGGLGIYLYRWKTQYRRRTTVIAQYEPYEQFQPLFTGVLFDNRLDTQDITAGIISLAEQGFISITQKIDKVFFVFETNDYEVELLRSPQEAGQVYADELFSLLFAEPKAGLLTAGKKVRLSEIKKNQTKLLKNAKIIKNLQQSVKKRLQTQGFLESDWSQKIKTILFGFIGLVIIAVVIVGRGLSGFLESPVFGLLLVLILASLFLVVIFASTRRTTKGYEAMYYLRGFKDFLSVTEKERYTFHNAPSKSPEQFMKFLPYAIAFGVEKEWSEVFADISIPAPSWYQSDIPGSQFSASAFTSELSSFSNSLSRSASSGSSGSGSAGGGSGGGGGGSW